jgi:hypothetical protein
MLPFFANGVTGESIHASCLFIKCNAFFYIQSQNQHEIEWKDKEDQHKKWYEMMHVTNN